MSKLFHLNKIWFILLSLFLFGCSQTTEISTSNFTQKAEPIPAQTSEPVEERTLVQDTQDVVEKKILSPYITEVETCDLSGTEIIGGDCDYHTSVFLDENGNRYPVPAGAINHAGDAWVYGDGPIGIGTLFIFNARTGETQELMSVLDTTFGVSSVWNQDDSKLALVFVNQNDESYLSTLGTKLFVFSFDAAGRFTQKDRYLLQIKYGCSDSGCDSLAGEDFYFQDLDTLVYYTWEGAPDPYVVERTDEWKRSLDL